MAIAENAVSQLSFEAALARLEEIVRTREKGESPLDQSIELYQEGDRLRRLCEARLKAAQERIEQIAFGAAGRPSGVTPFNAGGDGRPGAARARCRDRAGPGRNRRPLRSAARLTGRWPRRPLRSDAPC